MVSVFVLKCVKSVKMLFLHIPFLCLDAPTIHCLGYKMLQHL